MNVKAKQSYPGLPSIWVQYLAERFDQVQGAVSLLGVWLPLLLGEFTWCVYLSVLPGLRVFHLWNMEGNFYQHYKYYHFYSICFGLGCGTALYRPFCSLVVPSVLTVFFAIVFEIVGIISDLPAHTRRCKGPPYVREDAYWGFCFALFVAILNLNSYHVYTLSYGCGIVMFALRGAKRKYSSLRKLRKRQRPRW